MADNVFKFMSPLHTVRLTLTIWDPNVDGDRKQLEEMFINGSRGVFSDADPSKKARQAVSYYAGGGGRINSKLLGGREPDRSAIWFVRLGANSPNGTVIGLASMVHRSYLPDQGWLLDAGHEGCGFATEAGTAVLSYFRDTLGVKEIMAPTHPANEKSTKVALRLGYEHHGATLKFEDGTWLNLQILPGSPLPPDGLILERFGSQPASSA